MRGNRSELAPRRKYPRCHVNTPLNTDIAQNSSSSFQAIELKFNLVLSDFFGGSSLIKLGYNFLGKARNENSLGN